MDIGRRGFLRNLGIGAAGSAVPVPEATVAVEAAKGSLVTILEVIRSLPTLDPYYNMKTEADLQDHVAKRATIREAIEKIDLSELDSFHEALRNYSNNRWSLENYTDEEVLKYGRESIRRRREQATGFHDVLEARRAMKAALKLHPEGKKILAELNAQFRENRAAHQLESAKRQMIRAYKSMKFALRLQVLAVNARKRANKLGPVSDSSVFALIPTEIFTFVGSWWRRDLKGLKTKLDGFVKSIDA